jgi:hypothetical protein
MYPQIKYLEDNQTNMPGTEFACFTGVVEILDYILLSFCTDIFRVLATLCQVSKTFHSHTATLWKDVLDFC